MIFKKKRTWWWVIGTLIALLGVALVRLVATKYPPGTTSIVIALIGYTLVIFGLFAITLATRRDE